MKLTRSIELWANGVLAFSHNPEKTGGLYYLESFKGAGGQMCLHTARTVQSEPENTVSEEWSLWLFAEGIGEEGTGFDLNALAVKLSVALAKKLLGEQRVDKGLWAPERESLGKITRSEFLKDLDQQMVGYSGDAEFIAKGLGIQIMDGLLAEAERQGHDEKWLCEKTGLSMETLATLLMCSESMTILMITNFAMLLGLKFEAVLRRPESEPSPESIDELLHCLRCGSLAMDVRDPRYCEPCWEWMQKGLA